LIRYFLKWKKNWYLKKGPWNIPSHPKNSLRIHWKSHSLERLDGIPAKVVDVEGEVLGEE